MVDNVYILGRKILYNELKPLFAALSSVRYAIIKGEVLSQQIYGVLDKRKSSDIDILIDKKNVKFLEEQLHKLGFEQKLPENNAEIRRNRVLCMAYSHQIPSYHKDIFGFHLNVDVNYDIFWGEYEGQRCSIDEFLTDTVDMEIYGVRVKTLTLEKAFVQLVLHHYREMNSNYHLSKYNTITSHMFSDVFELLMRNSSVLTLECVLSLCEKHSIGAYVYYMLYYTNLVFKKKMLTRYVEQLKLYRDEMIMESYGLSQHERKVWYMSFEKRLNNKNLHKYVCQQLSSADCDKIETNKKIFQ